MNSLFLDLLINKKKQREAKNYTIDFNDPSLIKKILSIIEDNIIHKRNDISFFHDFLQLFTEFSYEFIDDYIDITEEIEYSHFKKNLVLIILLKIIVAQEFSCTAIVIY